jgi:hypothetical protein
MNRHAADGYRMQGLPRQYSKSHFATLRQLNGNERYLDFPFSQACAQLHIRKITAHLKNLLGRNPKVNYRCRDILNQIERYFCTIRNIAARSYYAFRQRIWPSPPGTWIRKIPQITPKLICLLERSRHGWRFRSFSFEATYCNIFSECSQ